MRRKRCCISIHGIHGFDEIRGSLENGLFGDLLRIASISRNQFTESSEPLIDVGIVERYVDKPSRRSFAKLFLFVGQSNFHDSWHVSWRYLHFDRVSGYHL